MKDINFLKVIKAYAERLQKATECQVIVLPSEVNSEKFHLELSILPHPAIVGNGRVRFRIRATVFAEIPASHPAINDCLEKSICLAQFFDEAQNFTIDETEEIYGMAFHTALRDDDDLFADLEAEDRSYSYNESWLVALEFDLDKIKE